MGHSRPLARALVLAAIALLSAATTAARARWTPADAPGPAALPAQACEARPLAPLDPVGMFADISEASGIQAENYVPDPPRKIPINDHSRLGFADLNGDGFDDIVAHSLFPNSQARYTAPDPPLPFEHLVYLNRGDGTFANFSDASGLRFAQSAFLAFGDVDNDGDQDAFAGLDITDHFDGKATNHILLNDGVGRFERLQGSGVEVPFGQTVAANAVFADFDGDANLDLFVGNGGTSAAAPDLLYLGRGDGTFENASDRLEGNAARPSNGSVACDFDDDGDLDIFVSNYGISLLRGHDVLWRNDGTGRFVDAAQDVGFHALPTGNYFQAETGNGRDPEPGKSPGEWMGGNGFGLQCADVTGDGYLDIFQSAISHSDARSYDTTWSDPSALLVNQGPEGGYRLVNAFLERGLPYNEGDVDAGVADLDNDGRLDLSVSRDRKYEGNPLYTALDQKAWFGLFHQLADGSFASVGYESGVNDPADERFRRMKNAQNHAWSDVDMDGDWDLLVGGRDIGGGRPNYLFANEVGNANDWLGIRLEGDGEHVNRDAIGARVEVTAGGRTLLREVVGSRGMYNSMDMRTVLVGMGGMGCDYGVVVHWPDGTSRAYAGERLGLNRWWRVRYTQDPLDDGLLRWEPVALPPSVEPTPPLPPTETPTPEPTATPAPRPIWLPALLDGGELGGA